VRFGPPGRVLLLCYRYPRPSPARLFPMSDSVEGARSLPRLTEPGAPSNPAGVACWRYPTALLTAPASGGRRFLRRSGLGVHPAGCPPRAGTGARVPAGGGTRGDDGGVTERYRGKALLREARVGDRGLLRGASRLRARGTGAELAEGGDVGPLAAGLVGDEDPDNPGAGRAPAPGHLPGLV
jgi:hypothetical protein